MKKLLVPFTLISIFMLLLSACNNVTITIGNEEETEATETATPDAQATEDAETAQQEEIDAAVEATVEALPSPTPMPTVVYEEQTEEEMAETVEDSVNEANNATEELYDYYYDAASDYYLTDEELYYLEYYLYLAEVALSYSDELIWLYYELYGDYAYEAIEIMMAMEDDLVLLLESVDEIEAIVELGAEAASEAIEELNEAIENAELRHDDIQELASGWVESVQGELENRQELFSNLDITELATNREGAIILLHEYVASIQEGFVDGRISPEELFDIAQRGTNAFASIQEVGGPALQRFSGDITSMTGNLAGGQWPQAQLNLGGFQNSLPAKPSIPNIGLPNR